MKLVMTTARELFALFVDDGSLAIALLAWILVLHAACRFWPSLDPWGAAILFLGCIAVLIENTLRAAKRS
jgi:hypothetical protein